MDSLEIKKILRENFINEKKTAGEAFSGAKKRRKHADSDYSSIQRALNTDDTILTQSQVMQAAGLGDADNASDRSLFRKKVNLEKNDEGSVYKFNDEEKDAVLRVITNPTAFYYA